MAVALKNSIYDASLSTAQILSGDTWDPLAQMYPGYFSYLISKRKNGAATNQNLTLTLQGQVHVDDSGPSRVWHVNLIGTPPASIATVSIPTNDGNNVVIRTAYADTDVLDLLITGETGVITLQCVSGPINDFTFGMWQHFVVEK